MAKTATKKAATKKTTTSKDEEKVISTGSENTVKDKDVEVKDTPVVASVDKEEKPAVEPSKTTIEVDAGVLENLLKEVNDLKLQQSQYEQTASQDQIRKIESLRASGKLVKSVKVRRINGKIVLAWRMVTDDVFYADGKVHEKQEYEVTFEGGSQSIMDIRQFTRSASYESYEVIKESKLENGNVEYTLQMPDGKELVIGETYVN